MLPEDELELGPFQLAELGPNIFLYKIECIVFYVIYRTESNSEIRSVVVVAGNNFFYLIFLT